MSYILINGIETGQISVLDRGFQYGDGLFETVRVVEGHPQYWQQHINRLMAGCEQLKIPFTELDSLQNEAKKLCGQIGNGVLKITITRGEGGRGYAINQSLEANRVLATFPAPHYPDECWTTGIIARVCQTRLGINPALAGIKHLNRLEQVMARAEWNDSSIREGLMMDDHDNIIEGIMTNVFSIRGNELMTPNLSRCGVKGVMREQIKELATSEGLVVCENDLTLDDLYQSDELFVCNSLIGIWPVKQLETQYFTIGPISRHLQKVLNGKVYAT